MNAAVRNGALVLLVAAGVGLGGCVYYPVRTGVVYDGANGNAVVDYDDSVSYSRPSYYAYDADPYWYGPAWYGYGYGWPAISLGFYGGYWGGHHYRGPWRGGYYHGGWSGGRGGAPRVAAPSRGGRH